MHESIRRLFAIACLIKVCNWVADSMKEDARKMVLTMVDMERSYLTADVFRDIISQNGAVDGAEQPGLLRTLSGMSVPAFLAASLTCASI